MPRKRNYSSEYQRRNALARKKGYKNYADERRAAEQKIVPPYQDLTHQQQNVWHRASRAAREMADKGISLTQAAKKQGTTPATVIKYMGTDSIARRGRKWVPTQTFLERQGLIDRPERVIIITENGMEKVTISDASTLSEYGRYMNYVKGALRGDPEAIVELAKFEGKTFTDAKGKKRIYLTDRKLLIRLYDDDRISMEEFYVELAR